MHIKYVFVEAGTIAQRRPFSSCLVGTTPGLGHRPSRGPAVGRGRPQAPRWWQPAPAAASRRPPAPTAAAGRWSGPPLAARAPPPSPPPPPPPGPGPACCRSMCIISGTISTRGLSRCPQVPCTREWTNCNLQKMFRSHSHFVLPCGGQKQIARCIIHCGVGFLELT